jgi:hypothetical protein
MAGVEFDADYDITQDELLIKYYGGINDGGLYDEILTENAPNSIGKVTTEVLRANLTNIRDIITEIPPKDEFVDLLNILGGVTGGNLNAAVGELALRLAPYIRDRFTLLKLLGRVNYV